MVKTEVTITVADVDPAGFALVQQSGQSDKWRTDAENVWGYFDAPKKRGLEEAAARVAVHVGVVERIAKSTSMPEIPSASATPSAATRCRSRRPEEQAFEAVNVPLPRREQRRELRRVRDVAGVDQRRESATRQRRTSSARGQPVLGDS